MADGMTPSEDQTSSPYFKLEHEMLRDQVARFVREEVKPHADKWEVEGKIPREVLKKMGDNGFFGIHFPEEYGGSGLDTIATAIFAEELGKSTFGGFAITPLVHTDMSSVHINNAGNDEQKQRFLPEVIAGTKIGAIGLTEPGAGSDLQGIRTTAKKADGGWILNGSKLFITNGVYGDFVCALVRTGDKEEKASRAATMFIVEKGMEGFKVAQKLDKMGWRCSDTAELVFEDCFVPDENVIGEPGRGFYAAMKNLQNERIVIGAMCMGEAQAAIELTLDWVKGRKAFGGVLWDKQAIRQRLAMQAAKVEAGRQLVYRAAWMDSQGMDCGKEVSMLKAYCGELVNEVLYDCLQFHGGSGYIEETPINRMYRDVRVQSIGGGATEVMLEEVAKRL
ncbi:acyl-CoA dehydrogenase family protein [Aquisalinus luteolus]|uniref:Acyl-CoA dehydrogenase n=2 Tax=Aquisalinus luteolus TaxID=1566827 RepID=A0A8J3A4G9_9PROT|nr:acyl-CoA dehydrogenase family protein [Aquisalinus luteolus]GGH93312.1 acyl-CoA dehydrogenase [Aquisalinus luteolus]